MLHLELCNSKNLGTPVYEMNDHGENASQMSTSPTASSFSPVPQIYYNCEVYVGGEKYTVTHGPKKVLLK